MGVRNLADLIKVDSADPDDLTAQLAVVMLAPFAQMVRTSLRSTAAPARPGPIRACAPTAAPEVDPRGELRDA